MARPKKLPDGMYKRGKVYYARFRAGGRQIRKRLSTNYTAACELLNDMRARADKADFGILDNDYPWKDMKEAYIRWAKQQTRVGSEYETTLKKFEEYQKPVSLRQITHEYVFGFRQWRLDQGVTPRTVNKQVLILNALMNKAVEWGRIGINPIQGMTHLKHDHKSKERRSLTVEEINSILENSPEYLRPVWLMFMTTGLRKDELIELRFSDIDFERNVAIVRPHVAKNHQTREVPVCDEMMDVIRQLREAAPNRQSVPGHTAKATEQQEKNLSREHVFVSKAFTPLRNNLLDRFYAVCKKVGIDDAKVGGAVDIHALRVSFVTLAIENGADPKSVQEIIGHSTLALTMNVYTKARSQAKREAINALPFAKASAPKVRDVISIEEGRKTKKKPASTTKAKAGGKGRSKAPKTG